MVTTKQGHVASKTPPNVCYYGWSCVLFPFPAPSRAITVGEEDRNAGGDRGVPSPTADRQHPVPSCLFSCQMDLCDPRRYRGTSPSGSKLEPSFRSHQRDRPWGESPPWGCLWWALPQCPSPGAKLRPGSSLTRSPRACLLALHSDQGAARLQPPGLLAFKAALPSSRRQQVVISSYGQFRPEELSVTKFTERLRGQREFTS